MAKGESPDVLIIPEGPKPHGPRSTGIDDPCVRESLGRIASRIANGEPLAKIVESALGSLAEHFGISEMLFEVFSASVADPLRWATYGMSEARAESILADLSASYHPKDLVLRTLDERFRLSPNGHFIPAEDWLELVDSDPFGDHPSYYLHPESERRPRGGKDEWHEADLYMFSVRDCNGDVMAVLELSYSVDGKLLSKSSVEGIEPFVQLLSLALMREQFKGGTPARSASSTRTDLLEDILKIASSVVSERELKRLSDMILSTLSSLFGFGKVSLVVYDEFDGLFKWMALFGYDEDYIREARARKIPTDVIMDDLRENRRMGKSAYLTLAENVSSRSRSYYVEHPPREMQQASPRKQLEFRKGDCLAFALHDSAGRIVGVIYPSEPKDGLLPTRETIETIEIFTSLAEVAIENARLTNEREQALRTSGQRTEQLSRILDLVSGVMYVRNLEHMLDNLLKTLARLVGTKRMVLGVKDQKLGVYRVEAVYGYSPKAVEGIRKVTYPIDSVDTIPEVGRAHPSGYVRWWSKLGRMTYYMPAESLQALTPEELSYYPDPELIRVPRAGKGHWHELDFMDTLISDKDGVPIAYLETLKPRDDRIPDSDTIEVIEIFASLAGIAIENAKTFQEHVDSRREAELYTDVLSHDIKNFNQAILGYLDLLKMKVEKPEMLSIINKVGEQVMNTSWLASNVRTMSRVTFGDVELARMDLGTVLQECERSVTQYYPGRTIVSKGGIDKGVMYIEADELIRELFVNILTNAVKYDSHEPVEIDISCEKTYDDERPYWTVAIADKGIGIPDDIKPIIFDRFSKAPKKKGSGMGLHIVKTLATRYRGKVWVEDRVPGDPTKGAVFKVQLPAVE